MALKNLIFKKKSPAIHKITISPKEKIKIEPAAMTPFAIPNLVGMNAGEAFKLLQSLGMNYEIVGFKEVVPKNVAEGSISAQSPAAGTAYTLKTVVKLNVNMDLMM